MIFISRVDLSLPLSDFSNYNCLYTRFFRYVFLIRFQSLINQIEVRFKEEIIMDFNATILDVIDIPRINLYSLTIIRRRFLFLESKNRYPPTLEYK